MTRIQSCCGTHDIPTVKAQSQETPHHPKSCALAISLPDLQKPEHYLVTEMQPGWRPLTSYKVVTLLPGPAQAVSVLEQACWALAVAEAALQFEHRLPVVSAVLARPTRSPRVEFTLRGRLERVSSAGYKIRL
ncbi:hypothetical protein HPB49_012987 [Dermacentor silvarum]|uniref:Uncharacterized protein n=1 Tax=Dermacentor silvarum TaxID=543639 RepID=A0ACB8E0F5_DERSI|nr:hypothetical protein HPB49_012987 [Dermacentor silvarum]